MLNVGCPNFWDTETVGKDLIDLEFYVYEEHRY